MDDERKIAEYEYWKDFFGDKCFSEVVALREQVIILKEHQGVMETCIRHIGQDLVQIRREIEQLKNGV